MTTKRLLRYSALLITSFLAISCNDFGIMQSIQKETKQTASTVLKNTKVTAMVGTNANYYILLNKVFFRSHSGETWKVFGKGQLGDDYECRGIAASGTTLYIAAKMGTSYAVFSYTDGGTWTAFAGVPASQSIQGLFYANGRLFMATRDTAGVYSLWSTAATDFSGSLSTFDGIALLANIAIVGVTWNGSNYYVATTATTEAVYSGGPIAFNNETPTGFTASSENTVTAICSNGTAIYFSASEGNVYRSVAGAWDASAVSTSKKITSLAWLAADNKLLVGFGHTDYGYDLIDYSGPTVIKGGTSSDSLMGNNSIYGTTVGILPVVAFFIDSTSNDVFACVAASGSTTSYSGLYRTPRSGSVWTGWSAE